jgi:GDP-L-fucose synthase
MRILCVGVQSLAGAHLMRGLPGHQVVRLENEARLYAEPHLIVEELNALEPNVIISIPDGVVAERDNPLQVLQRRTLAMTNLVSAALEAGIPRLLNLESRAIYPAETPYWPVSIRDIGTGGMEPHLEAEGYAALHASKLTEFASLAASSAAFRTVFVSELYGAGGRSGETIESVVADVRQAMATKRAPIAIAPDRPVSLDALYVGDLVDFVGHAVERIDDLPLRMNLGSGFARPIENYYAAVAKVLGYEVPIVPVPPRLDNPTRAKDLNIAGQERFGWSPITDFEQGIGKMLAPSA